MQNRLGLIKWGAGEEGESKNSQYKTHLGERERERETCALEAVADGVREMDEVTGEGPRRQQHN